MSKLSRKSEDRRQGHLVQCHLGRVSEHSPSWRMTENTSESLVGGIKIWAQRSNRKPCPWPEAAWDWERETGTNVASCPLDPHPASTAWPPLSSKNYPKLLQSSLNTAASSLAKSSWLLWNTVVHSSVLLLCPICTSVVYFLLYYDY